MTFRLRVITLVVLCAVVLMLAGAVTAAAGNQVLLGDADNDGEVTIMDASCVQAKLAGKQISGFSEAAADIDKNGMIEITDATYIQRWANRLETPYPIGVRPTEPKPTQRPTDAEGWGSEIFRP